MYMLTNYYFFNYLCSLSPFLIPIKIWLKYFNRIYSWMWVRLLHKLFGEQSNVFTSGDWRNSVNDDMYLRVYIIQEADESKPHKKFPESITKTISSNPIPGVFWTSRFSAVVIPVQLRTQSFLMQLWTAARIAPEWVLRKRTRTCCWWFFVTVYAFLSFYYKITSKLSLDTRKLTQMESMLQWCTALA